MSYTQAQAAPLLCFLRRVGWIHGAVLWKPQGQQVTHLEQVCILITLRRGMFARFEEQLQAQSGEVARPPTNTAFDDPELTLSALEQLFSCRQQRAWIAALEATKVPISALALRVCLVDWKERRKVGELGHHFLARGFQGSVTA